MSLRSVLEYAKFLDLPIFFQKRESLESCLFKCSNDEIICGFIVDVCKLVIDGDLLQLTEKQKTDEEKFHQLRLTQHLRDVITQVVSMMADKSIPFINSYIGQPEILTAMEHDAALATRKKGLTYDYKFCAKAKSREQMKHTLRLVRYHRQRLVAQSCLPRHGKTLDRYFAFKALILVQPFLELELSVFDKM